MTLQTDDILNIDWGSSRPDRTPKKLLDVGRLVSLDWSARLQLADGLQSALAHYRQELSQVSIRL